MYTMAYPLPHWQHVQKFPTLPDQSWQQQNILHAQSVVAHRRLPAKIPSPAVLIQSLAVEDHHKSHQFFESIWLFMQQWSVRKVFYLLPCQPSSCINSMGKYPWKMPSWWQTLQSQTGQAMQSTIILTGLQKMIKDGRPCNSCALQRTPRKIFVLTSPLSWALFSVSQASSQLTGKPCS